MGKRFKDVETFTNKEIWFDYQGQEMCWVGDYGVCTQGEEPDWSYPGDCETEVTILETDSLDVWSEEQEEWIPVKETPSILLHVVWEIEKHL
jgi:hypothetical protein